MLGQPHPFARFVRLLGRGKTLSRALTIEEAEQAMAMILAGETQPEQLGAFLMLLRIKEETGEEIAGFIRAARAALPPSDAPSVDLDWPAYAGKKLEPGMKGATVSNVTKPAKLENGLVVQVPPFITEGEKIRVSTSESAYLERA